jgi:hypothetical protein
MAMEEGNGIIDSEVAAMMLGVSRDAVRMMVLRKKLVPVGKEGRKNTFNLQDIVALQNRRTKTKVRDTQ